MIRRLEREHLASDLASVEELLKEAPTQDIVGRTSLSARRDEIVAELAALDVPSEKAARAALIFGGAPVIGSQGIQADFAAKTLSNYESLVARIWASSKYGPLSKSGPVPDRSLARLHVTNVLQGSFGFELQELESPEEMAVPLRTAVEQTSHVITSAAEGDDALADAAALIDDRSFRALREFLGQLKKSRASLRVVSEDYDRFLSVDDVAAAADRTEASEIQEHDVHVRGVFSAVLPDARRFEFRDENGQAITGRVSDELTTEGLREMNANFGNRECIADFHVVSLQRGGSQRSRHILIGLVPVDSITG